MKTLYVLIERVKDSSYGFKNSTDKVIAEGSLNELEAIRNQKEQQLWQEYQNRDKSKDIDVLVEGSSKPTFIDYSWRIEEKKVYDKKRDDFYAYMEELARKYNSN